MTREEAIAYAKHITGFGFNDKVSGFCEFVLNELKIENTVIDRVLEIIDEFEKKPVRCKDSVYIIENDELWNAIKLHLTTEIMKLRGDKK